MDQNNFNNYSNDVNQNYGGGNFMREKLPNSGTVLGLGIASIPTCFCYIGFILAIIALVLAKKDEALYRAQPEKWDGYSNIKTGKILAYIGLAFGIIQLLSFVYIYFIYGWDNYMKDYQDILKGMNGGGY